MIVDIVLCLGRWLWILYYV